MTAPYNGGGWQALAGQIVSLPDATASALVTAGGATLYDMGLGAGVPNMPAGGYQAQVASESTAVFLARLPGGTPNPGDPVRALENSPPIIRHGHLEAY